ncbi:MAG TPA: nitrogenase iron-molybdenum cofactor biosynthesis protein NifE [Rhodospirillaceae bacterium]|nr:nitrogenase iron-molybdenum cofactor biosynthesis protein NifE [Rhodospirillaceae bacterium]
MLKRKVQELMNEPGCSINQSKSAGERKKGCGKSLVPGAAAGGCAFDGAKIALQPVTDVVHLVHGPIACEGNSWDGRNSWSSGSDLYRVGFTTDMSNLDIVAGGEKKLYRAIKEAIRRYDPPAVFVYQTCVGALIGDDIDAVCKAASERLGRPVVPVNAPGFVGSKNLGNRLAGEALLEHVIGTVEPDDCGPTDINILGEYNVAGELDQFRPLLARLGIRLRTSITGDARYAEVAAAHTARANMVLCSQALVTLARKMKERWGIPYFEGSFYGISDTSEALRNIARMLVERGADPGLAERTEILIAEEETKAWRLLEPYKARLAGRKVLLYTGGVKSWSVIQALQEVGMEVVGTSVRKATEADRQKALARLGDDEEKLADAITPRDMYAMFRDGKADMMLSGGRSQFVALKARTPWIDINQERHHGYAAYDGMVELIRQIDLSINNPIWAQVRAPAPWEEA